MRDSTLPQYKFVLSCYYSGYPIHFSIAQLGSQPLFSIDEDDPILGLDELIRFYQREHDDLFSLRLSSFSFVKGSLPPPEFCRTKMPDRAAVTYKVSRKSQVSFANFDDVASLLVEVDDSVPTTPVAADLFIDESRLQITPQKLGDGQFGCVFRGTLNVNKTRHEVAVKTLSTNHDDTVFCAFLRETGTLMKLDHPNIVKMIGIVKGPPMRLVLELQPLGSLSSYLKENGDQVTAADVRVWATQITSGMDYLESKRFVHRDLAARNILLASKNHAKISDFGLSQTISDENKTYSPMENERV